LTPTGDYDGDGLLDLFVCNEGPDHPDPQTAAEVLANGAVNFLYRNLGNGNFARITTGNIANDHEESLHAAWGDYDSDGDLDLVVGNHMKSNIKYSGSGGWNSVYSNPGMNLHLYQNLGDGTFARVAGGPVATDQQLTFRVLWGDYNGMRPSATYTMSLSFLHRTNAFSSRCAQEMDTSICSPSTSGATTCTRTKGVVRSSEWLVAPISR
jgi:hypothetical protein